MISFFLLIAVVFLAYANGANDNFKGVATLYGSKTANYRQSLAWATITTAGGAFFSVFFAQLMLKNFSGKGLVPLEITHYPPFLTAIALGAGLTVIFATFTGFPISTTHSLVGALVGAGFLAAGNDLNVGRLGKIFIIPLVSSPLVALVFAFTIYRLFRFLRNFIGIKEKMTLLVKEKKDAIKFAPGGGMIMASTEFPGSASLPSLKMVNPDQVGQGDRGTLLGINMQAILDKLHFLSAGLVSFSRGMNDTPKIFALLLAANLFQIHIGLTAVAVAMALGGLLHSRKVAEKISRQITPLNHGQGFTANLVTGILVIFASRMGVPVSTTHVSIGALFGIGISTGKINKAQLTQIVFSWVLTLPVAALLSGFIFFILT